ncbi:MAG: hypothetical protein ACKVZJ_08265 [Phycisphaerales bacterium]
MRSTVFKSSLDPEPAFDGFADEGTGAPIVSDAGAPESRGEDGVTTTGVPFGTGCPDVGIVGAGCAASIAASFAASSLVMREVPLPATDPRPVSAHHVNPITISNSAAHPSNLREGIARREPLNLVADIDIGRAT